MISNTRLISICSYPRKKKGPVMSVNHQQPRVLETTAKDARS